LPADILSLKLEADFDGMSNEERDEVLDVLHEAIKRISRS